MHCSHSSSLCAAPLGPAPLAHDADIPGSSRRRELVWETALLLTAEAGNTVAVELLLSAGSDLEATNEASFSRLQLVLDAIRFNIALLL